MAKIGRISSAFLHETIVIAARTTDGDNTSVIHELPIDLSKIEVLSHQREPIIIPSTGPYIKREPGPQTVIRIELQNNYHPEWRERKDTDPFAHIVGEAMMDTGDFEISCIHAKCKKTRTGPAGQKYSQSLILGKFIDCHFSEIMAVVLEHNSAAHSDDQNHG